MDATQTNIYEPLERRNVFDIRPEVLDSPDSALRAPKDEKHLVYSALLAAGIGFVLPYNSFIIAADYWQARFPGQSVALDMSMTYIIVAFTTVLLNNVLLLLAPFRVRVMFGYIVSFMTLIFVAVCEVAWHMFSANIAYSVNLLAVSLVAIGCTVQQSSFYGFASMLPKQYTQAVMAGESVAGFLVSSNRVVTKLLIQSDRLSTVIFFLTSTFYILLSYLLHLATINSPFVRYHMKACAKIVLRPDEERSNDLDENLSSSKFGVISLEPQSPNMVLTSSISNTATLSFSNPVYELSNPTAGQSVIEEFNNIGEISNTPHQESSTPPTVVFKVEHVLTPGTSTPGKLTDLRNGFASRWQVAQSIYPYMVCIALAYCVTLSLYPGIESEIVSCTLGSWLPVLLMFTFNTADVIGKILAGVPYPWSRRQLILMSGLRIVLVPLLLMCCAPRHQPVISGETAAFIFTIALGVSNGLAGSLPMMLAPAKVSGTLKEVTGNIMTLSYNVGLTAGSLIGYVFESMLGAQLVNPCPKLPYSMGTKEQKSYQSFLSTMMPFATLYNTTKISPTVFPALTANTPTDLSSISGKTVNTTLDSLTATVSSGFVNNTTAALASTAITITKSLAIAPSVSTEAVTSATALSKIRNMAMHPTMASISTTTFVKTLHSLVENITTEVKPVPTAVPAFNSTTISTPLSEQVSTPANVVLLTTLVTTFSNVTDLISTVTSTILSSLTTRLGEFATEIYSNSANNGSSLMGLSTTSDPQTSVELMAQI